MELLTSIVYKLLHVILIKFDDFMSWLIRRVLRGAMHAFSWFVIPYSRLVNLRIAREKIPPMKNDLLLIPAVKLAYMIRTKQIKSEDVVQAYIDRCKEVNPLLNAIVEDRFEEALNEARNIDAEIEKGTRTIEEMEQATPLLGIPITVKESIAVKGMSNQGGRVYKKKQIADEDAPIVREVKKHGGIILLVSNTPELCLCWETYNHVTGQTRNPHDLRRTPGGSSGGESALLGAGASLLGLTSDVAGSARLPAMFTGVYGHKPTPFLVSPYGHAPQSDAANWGHFFTTAPMCRYASDLPLLLKCMKDPNGPPSKIDTPVDIKNIRFFYMENDGPSGLTQPIDRDIQSALSDVAKQFKAKQVQIELLKWSFDISLSAMLRIENVETIYYKTEEGEAPKTISKELLKYTCGVSDSIFPSVFIKPLQNIMNNCIPESRHLQLESITKKLRAQFLELLGDNGVFLYPAFPNSAHEHYEIYHKLVDTSYMMVFNTLGLPVTSCMIGLDRHKLPIGIQVVGNPNQDHLTIAVAKELEKLYGGWVCPPTAE